MNMPVYFCPVCRTSEMFTEECPVCKSYLVSTNPLAEKTADEDMFTKEINSNIQDIPLIPEADNDPNPIS